MTDLIALSGSLRRGSFNTALARTCAELAPADTRIEVVTPQGIPLYDGDAEADEGVPAQVESLKARIAGADGVILVTPEYNQGVPGVLKNTIDWLTRPPADIGRVFGDRPFALCGASAGRGGTRASQYAWLPTLRALKARVWNGGQLYLPQAGGLFDEDGRLTDDATRERVEGFVGDFVAFCGQG